MRSQELHEGGVPFRVSDVLGAKWTICIIAELLRGARRFGQLQSAFEGISPRTLTERLRQLEAEGFISRQAFAEAPPRVEYTLTVKGMALAPVIQAMCRFESEYLE